MNIKNILMMVVVIILLMLPSYALTENNQDKIILFTIDSISKDEVKKLELENCAIGLVNIKSRKPYDDKNFYKTLNTGRKISEKVISEDIELEYLGDILKNENPYYIGSKSSDIKYLISNQHDISKGVNNIEYNLNWINDKLSGLEDKSNLIVIDYELGNNQDRLDILKNILSQNRDKLIYIIPKNVHPDNAMLINGYLVPILKINNEDGILSSESTKRKGFIAIEDISVDIKSNFGKYNKNNIGKVLDVEKSKDSLTEIESIYKKNINLLYIASIFHGLMYIGQGLILIYLLTGKFKNLSQFILVFSTNNIWLSIILGAFNLHKNLILYTLLIFIINFIITKNLLKNKENIGKTIISTYILIIVGVLFMENIIYNSYMGFNNLVYGARFYGLNNGMAAVLLSTSIFTVREVDRIIGNKTCRNLLIFTIPIINLLILSAKFGANTGSFISAILLLLLIYYKYFFVDRVNYKIIAGFIIIGIILFSINIYFDSISSSKSHAIQFFTRIKENGFQEMYYMLSFKLKELIKLTVLPPFSLVLLSQFIIISRCSRRLTKELKIMLITALLGFSINDTGNILLIYMLNYIILILFIDKNDIYS